MKDHEKDNGEYLTISSNLENSPENINKGFIKCKYNHLQE